MQTHLIFLANCSAQTEPHLGLSVVIWGFQKRVRTLLPPQKKKEQNLMMDRLNQVSSNKEQPTNLINQDLNISASPQNPPCLVPSITHAQAHNWHRNEAESWNLFCKLVLCKWCPAGTAEALQDKWLSTPEASSVDSQGGPLSPPPWDQNLKLYLLSDLSLIALCHNSYLQLALVLDINTHTHRKISKAHIGYAFPVSSPNSTALLFHTSCPPCSLLFRTIFFHLKKN